MAQRREKQQNKLLLIEVENICSFRDIRVVSQTNLIRKRKRCPQALQHDPRQASKQQTHTKYEGNEWFMSCIDDATIQWMGYIGKTENR